MDIRVCEDGYGAYEICRVRVRVWIERQKAIRERTHGMPKIRRDIQDSCESRFLRGRLHKKMMDG